MPSSGKPRTVYLANDVAVSLNRTASRGLSAAITLKLRRYAVIIEKSKPPLTPAEWEFLTQNFGSFSADSPEHLRALAPLVKAWLPAANQMRPAGVDPSSLAYRIEALSIAQLIALIEHLESS